MWLLLFETVEVVKACWLFVSAVIWCLRFVLLFVVVALCCLFFFVAGCCCLLLVSVVMA